MEKYSNISINSIISIIVRIVTIEVKNDFRCLIGNYKSHHHWSKIYILQEISDFEIKMHYCIWPGSYSKRLLGNFMRIILIMIDHKYGFIYIYIFGCYFNFGAKIRFLCQRWIKSSNLKMREVNPFLILLQIYTFKEAFISWCHKIHTKYVPKKLVLLSDRISFRQPHYWLWAIEIPTIINFRRWSNEIPQSRRWKCLFCRFSVKNAPFFREKSSIFPWNNRPRLFRLF